MSEHDPIIPRWIGRFLKLICPEHLYEEIEGDLIYRYNKDLLKHSNNTSKRRLVWNALRFFRPGILMRNNFSKGLNYQIMLKYHLLVAWRVLLKNKLFSATNIGGLTIAFICCTLITLYVQQELSYDLYHEKAGQIYRVVHLYDYTGDTTRRKGAPSEYQVWGNAPVGPAMESDFPEVLETVRFSGRKSALLQHGDKRYQQENVFYVDSTMFNLFSWKLLKGDAAKALAQPNSILLTETTAKKYFGAEDPMGKLIKYGQDGSLMVTGILEDVPGNSHFTFDVLIPMSSFYVNRPQVYQAWGYVDFYTYFMVPPAFDIHQLEKKIPAFLDKYEPDGDYNIAFEPLTDAYLHSKAQRQPGPVGSLYNIYFFSAIAVFILFIACINFMNLSTARSMTRAKEVGVRKVSGARQNSLVMQFLTESMLVSVIAGAASLLGSLLLLPGFRQLTDKQFSSDLLLQPGLLSLLAITAIGVGFIAGIYPAFVLSSFKASQVIKGIITSSQEGKFFRKALVVFQFSLSVALIAGTTIVFIQLDHLRTSDLGFKQQQMLVISYDYDSKVQAQLELIKNEFARRPDVLSAAASRTVPGGHFPKAHTEIETANGEMHAESPDLYEVDFDFIDHFGIEVIAGRSYSKDFLSDTAKSMVINRAAAQLWGYQNPEDIVGKKFSQWGKTGRVIGVVENFNYVSLHNQVEPLTLRLEPRYSMSELTLQLETNNLPATVKEIESTWNAFAPHRPFLYSFLDDSFNRQYLADIRFGEVFTVFAVLAIFIACLGLFGLAAWTAERRIKEIGVRRVLGASFGQIVQLLSMDFIKLVMIAIVVATPLAWYVMGKWLDSFAYQVEIQWWVFAFAGLLAIIIALVTVSFQSIKAASANPAQSLRTE